MAERKARSEVAGSVWKILASPGDALADGDTILILESMKMEIPVMAEGSGTLREILVAEGEAVAEGQIIALIEG